MWRSGRVSESETDGPRIVPLLGFFRVLPALSKKFDTFNSRLKKFDIYSKIVVWDVENFFPHPFRVSNFSVNSFYSVAKREGISEANY
jgi:hypothetical protein